MKQTLRRYLIVATIITICWIAFTAYTAKDYVTYSSIIAKEIHANSRRIGQEIYNAFEWFESKQKVYVINEEPNAQNNPPSTRITATNGEKLTQAVPINFIKTPLMNEFRKGIDIRFVSNKPLNIQNLPTPMDNQAMLLMGSQSKQDTFSYDESQGHYHYMRPLFATKNCLTCHTNTQENALIGAVVINTNPKEFILNERYERIYFLTISLILGTLGIAIFYFFIWRAYRTYKNQGEHMEYSKAMLDNMSQEVELVLNNVSRILNETQEDGNNPQRAELLRTLQNINQGLLVSAQKITEEEKSRTQVYGEEIFHVDTFFQQCMHIFSMPCHEKNIGISLDVDNSVPTYLLGNAFYLRQLLIRILKQSLSATNKGSIHVRVRSALDMPSQFSTTDLNSIPIHLIIEVQDTSSGYIVTSNSAFWKNYTPSKKSGQTHVDLATLNDLARMLSGSVTIPHNKKDGATFVIKAQMKLVDEENVQLATVHTSSLPRGTQVLSTNTNAPTSSAVSMQTPNFPHTTALHTFVPQGANAKDTPISVIIGDSGIMEIAPDALKVFEQNNFKATLFRTADSIFKVLDNPNHGFSAIFLRELSDLDIIYTATRIRYLEHSGGTSIAIILINETIVHADMEVLRFFNVSTVNNFPRDPNIIVKITDLALRTHSNKIFQGDNFYEKTDKSGIPSKLFDARKAMANAKNDKALIHSICSMWVRFYPAQLERIASISKEGNKDDHLRLLRSIKNSAATVSLPLLWEEANRLEKMVMQDNPIRYEKLLSIYEESYNLLKAHLEHKA